MQVGSSLEPPQGKGLFVSFPGLGISYPMGYSDLRPLYSGRRCEHSTQPESGPHSLGMGVRLHPGLIPSPGWPTLPCPVSPSLSPRPLPRLLPAPAKISWHMSGLPGMLQCCRPNATACIGFRAPFDCALTVPHWNGKHSTV